LKNIFLQTLFLLALFNIIPLSVEGYFDIPACYKTLPEQFFRRDPVLQALSLHRINQGSWGLIYTSLQTRSKEVFKMVNARAKKLTRNPLEHPFQPKEATQLLKESLFGVFQSVLLENQINQPDVINKTFEYIWSQQAGFIRSCLGYSALE
jgi:hypothetical protein